MIIIIEIKFFLRANERVKECDVNFLTRETFLYNTRASFPAINYISIEL